jgi:hypothetical protein
MPQRVLIDHNFGHGFTGGQSNEGPGVNQTVDDAMTALRDMREEAVGFRSVASSALGMTGGGAKP